MRVPGQKFFVPANKRLAGMARSYNYSSTSLNVRAAPDCQRGIFNPKVCCSFVVSIRELCGRLASVGQAVLGMFAGVIIRCR